MNAPVLPLRAAVSPIGVDVFDRDRRAFLQSFREFMRDPKVPAVIKEQEFRATISALSQIAALVEVG
jgi:hypothetical protein